MCTHVRCVPGVHDVPAVHMLQLAVTQRVLRAAVPALRPAHQLDMRVPRLLSRRVPSLGEIDTINPTAFRKAEENMDGLCEVA